MIEVSCLEGSRKFRTGDEFLKIVVLSVNCEGN